MRLPFVYRSMYSIGYSILFLSACRGFQATWVRGHERANKSWPSSWSEGYGLKVTFLLVSLDLFLWLVRGLFFFIFQWELICNRNHLKALTQASYLAGLLIGSYAFSSISDHFGRRIAVFLSIAFLVSKMTEHHLTVKLLHSGHRDLWDKEMWLLQRVCHKGVAWPKFFRGVAFLFLKIVTVAYNLYVTHSKYINKIKLKYNDAHELETICMRLVWKKKTVALLFNLVLDLPIKGFCFLTDSLVGFLAW